MPNWKEPGRDGQGCSQALLATTVSKLTIELKTKTFDLKFNLMESICGRKKQTRRENKQVNEREYERECNK